MMKDIKERLKKQNQNVANMSNWVSERPIR